VRDSKLQSELSRLVERNKRIDHDASGHDDHVISWLLCHWFLTYGRNLEHYGITLSEVKRRVYEAEHKLSWDDQRRYDQQQQIRDQISELVDKLGSEKNTYERIKIQHRLDVLMSRVSDEFELDGVGSIDQIKESNKEKRAIVGRTLGPGRELQLDRPINFGMTQQRRTYRQERGDLVVR